MKRTRIIEIDDDDTNFIFVINQTYTVMKEHRWDKGKIQHWLVNF